MRVVPEKKEDRMPKIKGGCFLIDDRQTGPYKTYTDEQRAEIQALFDTGKITEAETLMLKIENKRILADKELMRMISDAESKSL